MVEKIKANKDKILAYMEMRLAQYGSNRIDTKEMGELADIVKDLAAAEESCWEAQYYRTVTEAMESGGGSQGYGSMGGRGYDSMGDGGRRGYGGGRMGHSDPMETIRKMIETNPELRNELMGM